MTALNADPRQAYIRAEERKRSLASFGISLGVYALALLVLWIAGFGRELEYSDYGGPVLIRLGTPEGVEVPSPSAPPAPKPVPESAPPAAAPSPQAPAAPPPEIAKTAQAKAPASAPPAPTPTVPSTESAPAGPVLGEEYGNSHETTFEASVGRVGRSLYVPIWTFMPPPKTVEDRVYNAIPGDGFRTADEQKLRFQNYYEFSSGLWRLKQDVPLDSRQPIWLMLEGSAKKGSGFNLSRADYKVGRSLSDVQIRFRVGPSQGNSPPNLEAAELVQSSGDPEIDAAVMYGFRRASFSNDSDKSVTGRFAYRF